MVNPLKAIKEVVLIDRIAKRFKARHKDIVVSIGDDTAVIRSRRGRFLLYTADMQVEGVHFRKGEDPKKVGYKAMAVSASDIAAMGGIPKYALVSVGLPKKNVEKVMKALMSGISLCANKFKVDVIGGDTNRSPHLVIDCFMVGEVEEEKLVLRSGAKAKDHIFVTGPLGGSLKGKHLSFTPKVKESRFLVENFKVTAMIDLSDGLALDLNRIASASKCGALIFENKIPKSKNISKIHNALFDGEDFELLFTLKGADARRFLSLMAKKKTRFRFYSIGRMTDLFRGVRMVTWDGRVQRVACNGFKHF